MTRRADHADGPPAAPRRLACIDLPALPLQLVLRAHPQWRDDPVVVVEDDRPQARILWANLPARRQQIVAGLRFQQAQALVPRVHAAVVASREIDQANTELLRLLLSFSPEIEPARERPGLFFADAHGLHALYTSLEHWAHSVHQALVDRRFVAAVVLGFTRQLALAIARTHHGWLLLRDLDDERTRAARVPLQALDTSPTLRQQLRDLGIHTLGEFLQLPAADLRLRLGKEAVDLHARASAAWTPLLGAHPVEPVTFAFDFELPDTDLERLLHTFADRLQAAMLTLQQRRELLVAVQFTLFCEHAEPRHERLATAEPTRDVDQVLELIRLRLGQNRLPGPVERGQGRIDSVVATARQLELLAATHRRDLAAANRALARLKAIFGDAAITRARVLPRHLPEQAFCFEPTSTMALPRATPLAPTPPLVRTLLRTPVLLGSLPVHEPESWLPEYGAVQRAHGPFRLREGWWQQLVERDYFFLETDRGAILWVFHDRRQRRWFLHGRID